MAAMESASSCLPQAKSQPEPPMVQAPKPTGVILRFELPSLRVCIDPPEILADHPPFPSAWRCSCAGCRAIACFSPKFDEKQTKKLNGSAVPDGLSGPWDVR